MSQYRVEERDGFWFVVDFVKEMELVTVFDYEITAREICAKVNSGYPFFTHIPQVPLGTEYPRPHRIMPRPFPRKVNLDG